MQLPLLINLAIALGLGLLVGVERERTANPVAGARTFTLITLAGVMAGALGQLHGAWVLPAAFLGIVALLITGNLLLARTQAADPGMTTEVAAMLMFLVGALLASGFRLIATVMAGAVALLLDWKKPLQAVIERLSDSDYRAIMRLVLIGLVILPLLPDRSFGPYEVLNPFRIWLMVVLIVGISLASYVAWRLFGARTGVLLGGVLGGLISSTAATVGYARRTKHTGREADPAAVMILIASTVVFGRVLLEITIVAPRALPVIGPPLVVMFILMLAISAVAWRSSSGTLVTPEEPEPPSDLKSAILFGLLYAAVLFGVAVTRQHLGTRALYGVAALSGLTDMDAITLSTAQVIRAGQLDGATGWRLIVVGAMANLVFKAGAIAVLGSRRLLRRITTAFGVAIAGGLLLMLLWPG